MKLFSNFTVVLVLSYCFVSCNNNSQTLQNTPFQKTQKASKIIAANNSFAFDFFKEVSLHEDDQNYMVSPVSLSLALGMLYNGAEGFTKEKMAEVLGVEGFTSQELSEENQKISNTLQSDKFQIANSNWIRENFSVKQDFIDLNETYYDAEIRTEDFANPKTVDFINDWVSLKTNDKIPTIIDEISNSEVLFLINAIYFNANWKYEFDPKSTQKRTFYTTSEESSLVDMMQLHNDNLQYLKTEVFQSVILPYKGDKYQMTVLLPNNEKEIADITNNLSAQKWNEWQNNHTTTEIEFALPKFKFEYKNTLNDELSNLGLENLFGKPNLSAISDQQLSISKVLQKTFIDVNEEGTEAAAVTSIGIEVTSIPDFPIVHCNKPFLFAIAEKETGAICFIGKVGKPNH